MFDHLKKFALENAALSLPVVFFLLIAALFLIAALHALKMKKPALDQLASLALKPDTPQGHDRK